MGERASFKLDSEMFRGHCSMLFAEALMITIERIRRFSGSAEDHHRISPSPLLIQGRNTNIQGPVTSPECTEKLFHIYTRAH